MVPSTSVVSTGACASEERNLPPFEMEVYATNVARMLAAERFPLIYKGGDGECQFQAGG